ncbi:MAG: hypothetical protein K0R15_422 [Clostridiales bacterium]|jgi:GAF domain-containing protein|nr:hypothetical protein [Clostridiales bacterium]
MEHTLNIYPEDKKELYKLLKKQMKSILEDEHNTIANLANSSALINEALKDINWVGFYLMNDGELLLGPFQGKVACVHIQIGRGVCGTSAFENKTQLVKDVHQFPGHIACDSASNSEIVVPLRHDGKVVGVLDIDSPLLSRFDEIDAVELEELVKIIEQSCNWN